MSVKRQWGIEKISSHAIAQHLIVEAFCFDSCLQRVYLNYFPGYSSHQSSLCFRHSPDPACLYFSSGWGSEMIWWVVRPPVYSGAHITLLSSAPHLLLSCSHDVSPGGPRLCHCLWPIVLATWGYVGDICGAMHCIVVPVLVISGHLWTQTLNEIPATGSFHSTDSKKEKCYFIYPTVAS